MSCCFQECSNICMHIGMCACMYVYMYVRTRLPRTDSHRQKQINSKLYANHIYALIANDLQCVRISKGHFLNHLCLLCSNSISDFSM